MRFLLLVALVAATVAPASAQTPVGMSAMQYYVGTWACSAAGEADSNATATFTIQNGVMHDSVILLPQGKMTVPYELTIITTFDPKNNRYVRTSIDSQAAWAVSFEKPFTGNTEEWVDNAASNGKLGRTEIVRTDQKTFNLTGYSTQSQAKPDFTVTCHRS